MSRTGGKGTVYGASSVITGGSTDRQSDSLKKAVRRKVTVTSGGRHQGNIELTRRRTVRYDFAGRRGSKPSQALAHYQQVRSVQTYRIFL